MAIRVKWDEYETAILIDGFWKIEQNHSPKADIIKNISNKLRARAINQGISIDDTFRNVNGISMQLAPIGHAFFPDRPTLTTSAMFEKIVEMYKSDRDSFDKLLARAEEQVKGEKPVKDNLLNKQQLSDWLDENENKRISTNVAIECLCFASQYGLSHKLIKSEIWDSITIEQAVGFISKLCGMHLFRIVHKNMALSLDKLLPLLKSFCSEMKQRTDISSDSFDRTEVIFLLDQYRKYKDRSEDKSKIIVESSDILRKRALYFENVIDEQFRSISKINLYFDLIENLIQNPQTNVGNQLFNEIVLLYLNDAVRYDRQSKLVSEQLNKFKTESKPLCVDEKNAELTKSENSEKALEENYQDVDFLSDIVFSYLKEESAINQYGTTAQYIALKSNAPEKEVKAILDNSEWSKCEYGRYKFIEDSSEEILKLDFTASQSLSFSRPVKFSYFDEVVCEPTSWRELYVTFLKALYEDYPEKIDEIAGNKQSNTTVPLIARKEDLSVIRVPGQFSVNLWAELNRSAKDLVVNMKKLLDICCVDYDNICIQYKRKSAEVSKVESTEIAIEEPLKGQKKISEINPHPVETTNPSKYIRLDKEAFYQWLLNSADCAPATGASYVSAIKGAEEFARSNISSSCKLFSANTDVIKFTVDSLFKNNGFIQLNNSQHNRFGAAIKKYLQYMAIDKDFDLESHGVTQSEIKSKTVCSDANIKKVISLHYAYGFNINSPIELIKFRNYYSCDVGKDCSLEDQVLVREIRNSGFEFNGKIYVLEVETIEQLKNLIKDMLENKILIAYYEELFFGNEDWLCDGKILSAEMLKEVLNRLYPRMLFKPNYFLLKSQKISEKDALISEIIRVWGEQVLHTFDELNTLLKYVPLDKIKYALSYGEKFTWNSFETYSRNDYFKITDEQKAELVQIISINCDENGSTSFDELPLDEIAAENFELSDSALHESVFLSIADKFDRYNKVITRKGKKIDTNEAIYQYCKSKESCSMSELEQVMKDTAGEVRYPIVIEASNSVMVRISQDDFVADRLVNFDVASIDAVLDDMVSGNGIGMLEITTFGAFPFCGYSWNHYLLESYCRRFSNRYKYLCITPNSRNAGAIVRKTCDLNYHNIMAEAIARTSVQLKEDEVFDYLISAGFMLRRQYNAMDDLLDIVNQIRERKI